MRGRTRVVSGRARHLSVCVSVWKPGSSKYVGGVHTEQLVPLRLSAIHANKERCPTMHFPSVVHLAPRRNDLFDVYSRSLTLIKITASPRFASLFFFLFFLSLSRARFFWGSFAYIASFLRFTLRRSKGLPSGDGNGATIRIFAFYPVSHVGVRLKAILALISRVEARTYTGCLRNHGASGDSLRAKTSRRKRINIFFRLLRFSSESRKFQKNFQIWKRK